MGGAASGRATLSACTGASLKKHGCKFGRYGLRGDICVPPDRARCPMSGTGK